MRYGNAVCVVQNRAFLKNYALAEVLLRDLLISIFTKEFYGLFHMIDYPYSVATSGSTLITSSTESVGWSKFYKATFLSPCSRRNREVHSIGANSGTLNNSVSGKSLLAFASTVILGSGPCGTHDYIFSVFRL
jgi:hypothetical protein